MTASDSKRPMIGILLDYVAEGSFSSRPHYALRQGYFDAIEAAGGVPIALPYQHDVVGDYLDRIDGIVLPGGFYPFPGSYYGEAPEPGETIHPRVAFETDFANAILDRDKPVLGICAGMQVLGAALGAMLYRDLHEVVNTSIDHLNEKPAEEIAHDVTVTPGTRLHEIVGRDSMGVNTAHREALAAIPDGAITNAVAPDGVIEGMEIPSRKFALAVQWHPEFFRDPGDPNLALFEHLVKVSSDG
jgi:putative glutamine amidotransferase